MKSLVMGTISQTR